MKLIQKKKVLYSSGRIICNKKRVGFEQIKAMIESYIYQVKKLKDTNSILIDLDKLNSGIRFDIFDLSVTVIELFDLYNEIAPLRGEKYYSKLWYNPSKSTKISPVNIS